MPFTHRPPIISFALKACTAAVASAVLLSSAVHAAGLGKLTVLSALGQPLRCSMAKRSGRQYIKVTSTQPLNEPFVDLLLELSWNNGRLVREYTFLLDPAELRRLGRAAAATAQRDPDFPCR
jgi:pilus assembly protein FimV